jgi:hypothetical protein
VTSALPRFPDNGIDAAIGIVLVAFPTDTGSFTRNSAFRKSMPGTGLSRQAKLISLIFMKVKLV